MVFWCALVRLECHVMFYIGEMLDWVEHVCACELPGCLVQGPGGSVPASWHGILNKFPSIGQKLVKL